MGWLYLPHFNQHSRTLSMLIRVHGVEIPLPPPNRHRIYGKRFTTGLTFSQKRAKEVATKQI